jgi:hypothetical protein
MNYTMICEARELAGWNAESEALSVYQAMKSITDTRGKKGKRYSLALVLTCIMKSSNRSSRAMNGNRLETVLISSSSPG